MKLQKHTEKFCPFIYHTDLDHTIITTRAVVNKNLFIVILTEVFNENSKISLN